MPGVWDRNLSKHRDPVRIGATVMIFFISATAMIFYVNNHECNVGEFPTKKNEMVMIFYVGGQAATRI
jgi:hypothetical protein